MAVGDAMVGGQRRHNDRSWHHLTVDDPGPLHDLAESDQGNLGRLNDSEYGFHPLLAQTGDGNCRVGHF